MSKFEESKEKVSGNMANNMEELKVLGKEMEQIREEQGTNGQAQGKQTNDPIQFDEKTEK